MTPTTSTTTGGIVVHDVGKLVLLSLVISGLFVSLILDRISEAQFWPALTLIIGYLVGNGVNAARGAPGSPALIARSAGPALVVHQDHTPEAEGR